ncbi:hypothetical protein BU24DRAFT_424365 [Aaosphaeria arxii CBS 175.79]|uniref:Uncharacterized protein n=1 Tax=Aaosphaeria arxii CBS 175.79 TaxID=1450172 RepID=A0A6A5XKI9_9PLEO|nr:uncharacterized protein BU24DRAFT_424365 [Aaosphaeria arxii CBS 175.79]KAF2013361.1 hypothetical protein BU24DRAFT_424365 [Aaosphaeria arxii CBS 175.79]
MTKPNECCGEICSPTLYFCGVCPAQSRSVPPCYSNNEFPNNSIFQLYTNTRISKSLQSREVSPVDKASSSGLAVSLLLPGLRWCKVNCCTFKVQTLVIFVPVISAVQMEKVDTSAQMRVWSVCRNERFGSRRGIADPKRWKLPPLFAFASQMPGPPAVGRGCLELLLTVPEFRWASSHHTPRHAHGKTAIGIVTRLLKEDTIHFRSIAG